MAHADVISRRFPRQPGVRPLPGWLSCALVALISISAISNADAFSQISAVHYIIYTIPVLIPLVWYFFPQSRFNGSVSQGILLFLMMLSLGLAAVEAGANGYKYLVFMLAGFLPFLFPLVLDLLTVAVFLIMISAAQIFLFFYIGGTAKTFDLSSLSSGSASLSHTLPVLFGLILGVMLINRRWGLAALCVVMIMVAGKRSVLLASALSSLGMFLGSNRVRFRPAALLRGRGALFSTVILALGFTIALRLPAIYVYLANRLGTNVNVLSSGRYAGQYPAFQAFFEGSFFETWFGHGLGTADLYAVAGFQGLATLIHCDYLRLLLDLGIVPGAAFSFLYMLIIGQGRLGRYYTTLSAVMWISENNLINVLVPVAIYICHCSDIRLTQDNEGRAFFGRFLLWLGLKSEVSPEQAQHAAPQAKL